MASWSPREAAEYRVAVNAQMLRELATDKVARRGLRRLVGVARASGFSKVAVAGVHLAAATAAASPGHLLGGTTAAQQDSEAADPLRQRRGSAPKEPPQPWRRLPAGMHGTLRHKPGWFTSGTWKANPQYRFGIKKQMQKLQFLLRVAAGTSRWIARARARVSARGRAGGHFVHVPPPPASNSLRPSRPTPDAERSKMRRLEITEDDDEEMGQVPSSPPRDAARDELALLNDASRLLAQRSGGRQGPSASGDGSSRGGMGRGRGRRRDAG
jgi:hypothetical protein